MSSIAPLKTYCVLATIAVAPLMLMGCQNEVFRDGGPEVHFLTSKPPVIKALNQPLLPLAPGTTWDMAADAKGIVKIQGRVIGQDASGGSLIEFRKNGSLWRREAYSNTTSGLFLLEMGEDEKPMMRLSPPVPILRYPLHEGDSQSWRGIFRYGTLVYPATSFSRISALEKIKSPLGAVFTYRIDTLITINQEGKLVKFPTIRWLAPGTGFMQRSFVDEGHNYLTELRKFTPGK